MNTRYRLLLEDGYVRITAAPKGVITLEDLLRHWAVLLEALQRQRSNLVLVEGAKVSLDASRVDGYEIAHMLFQIHCRALRIAVSVPKYDAVGGSTRCADNSQNDRPNVALFKDREEAIRWLGV